MQDHPLAGKQPAALPRTRAAERLQPPRAGDCPRGPRLRPRSATAAPQPRRPAAPPRAAPAPATTAQAQ